MPTKYRIQALNYRYRPVYMLDDLQACIDYGRSRKSFHGKFDVHRMDDFGSWILEYCSYETEKNEIKLIKKLTKVTYDKKQLYKELEHIFGTQKRLQHFPEVSLKKQDFIYIREADSLVFDKLKQNNIREKYFKKVEKITEKFFKCFLKEEFNSTIKTEELTLEDIQR